MYLDGYVLCRERMYITSCASVHVCLHGFLLCSCVSLVIVLFPIFCVYSLQRAAEVSFERRIR